MPDISIQQAYALAFGAYASPNGNSSFTIEGATNLPLNKPRLTGLLTTPNINLNQIPAEIADQIFDPVTTTFTLTSTQSLINETTSGGSGSTVVGETGTSDQRSSQLTKFLMVFSTNTVSGNLPLDSETVYVSSISPPSYSANIFPAASNITVSSAEGPYNIARLSKSGTGTISIDILSAKGSDANFWTSNNFGGSLTTDGLKISITGSTSSTGFNTIGNSPNNPEFLLEVIKFYPLSGVDSWSSLVAYLTGEYVKYNGVYYECTDDTIVGLGAPPDEPANWSAIDPLTELFQDIISNSITFQNQVVNGNNTFRINIPSAFYAQKVLGTNGRYTTNPNWMPLWISIGSNTTIIDAATGGGTAGNQCGTLEIKPLTDGYRKGSIWIFELSQPTPADNSISNGVSPLSIFSVLQGVNLIFTTVSSGGVQTPRLVYLNGGDINSTTTLTQTEKNYHRTGIGIVNKLKK